jgi:hypothetical protein
MIFVETAIVAMVARDPDAGDACFLVPFRGDNRLEQLDPGLQKTANANETEARAPTVVAELSCA